MLSVFLAAIAADKSVSMETTLLLYQALRGTSVMHVHASGSQGDSLDP
jgi:hypothetical protein